MFLGVRGNVKVKRDTWGKKITAITYIIPSLCTGREGGRKEGRNRMVCLVGGEREEGGMMDN